MIRMKWCVYGGLDPWGIGMVEQDYGKTLDIIKSERSSSEPWDSHYVNRFETSIEAIRYYRNHTRDYHFYTISEEQLWERLLHDFSSQFGFWQFA